MEASLSTLPNHRLLARMHELVRRDNALEAELLAYLGEVDARRLYLDEGFSSLFQFCTRALHFAEGVAYKRIQAARAARRHPQLLDAVRGGELHVTGVSLLAPRLDSGSCAELIAAARHRSADEIKKLLADREPRPDVPTLLTRLPAPVAAPAPALTRAAEAGPATAGEGENGAAGGPPVPAEPGPAASACEPPVPRARTEPLGAERYAVQFTASGEVFAQLQELRALMRHQFPDGDVGKILARAIGDLLAQVRKRKLGACAKPHPAKPPKAHPSRHIPAAIRRAVAQRDGGRCTFASASGRRCEAREFLEFDHVEPWQRTRCHSVEGIRLRCRAHNQHTAERDFGERHMNRFRKRAKPGADADRKKAERRSGDAQRAPARGTLAGSERSAGARAIREHEARPGMNAPSRGPGGRRQQDLNPVVPDSTPAASGRLDPDPARTLPGDS